MSDGLFGLDPESIELLRREAKRRGISLEAYCQMLLGAEARRLFYVERSRPKTVEAVMPTERVAELAFKLRGIFARRRMTLGSEIFERILGDMDRKLEKAIQDDDLTTLEWFDKEQPWRRKW